MGVLFSRLFRKSLELILPLQGELEVTLCLDDHGFRDGGIEESLPAVVHIDFWSVVYCIYNDRWARVDGSSLGEDDVKLGACKFGPNFQTRISANQRYPVRTPFHGRA